MCLVPDIDWENPIRSEVTRRELSLSDFTGVGGINPIAPFVGYVRFEFRENVKYPCIPVNVDGIPVYPRTSEPARHMRFTLLFTAMFIRQET